MRTYDDARTGAVLRARDLRRDSTEAEKILWRELREKLKTHKWRRQMPVGPYFADFACHAEKLIVELDGGQHAVRTDFDTTRSRYLATHGYRVLRFWNNEVVENVDGVMERIAEELSTSPSRGFAAYPSPAGRGREARSAGRVRL